MQESENDPNSSSFAERNESSNTILKNSVNPHKKHKKPKTEESSANSSPNSNQGENEDHNHHDHHDHHELKHKLTPSQRLKKLIQDHPDEEWVQIIVWHEIGGEIVLIPGKVFNETSKKVMERLNSDGEPFGPSDKHFSEFEYRLYGEDSVSAAMTMEELQKLDPDNELHEIFHKKYCAEWKNFCFPLNSIGKIQIKIVRQYICVYE